MHAVDPVECQTCTSQRELPSFVMCRVVPPDNSLSPLSPSSLPYRCASPWTTRCTLPHFTAPMMCRVVRTGGECRVHAGGGDVRTRWCGVGCRCCAKRERGESRKGVPTSATAMQTSLRPSTTASSPPLAPNLVVPTRLDARSRRAAAKAAPRPGTVASRRPIGRAKQSKNSRPSVPPPAWRSSSHRYASLSAKRLGSRLHPDHASSAACRWKSHLCSKPLSICQHYLIQVFRAMFVSEPSGCQVGALQVVCLDVLQECKVRWAQTP
mmetsp:Transcript_7061/g.15666  ORF Transcript_7061/g.15666 Transcript_7061/m.15666 type:complete len:267 (+) Transcript_7061:457-1257(+)